MYGEDKVFSSFLKKLPRGQHLREYWMKILAAVFSVITTNFFELPYYAINSTLFTFHRRPTHCKVCGPPPPAGQLPAGSTFSSNTLSGEYRRIVLHIMLREKKCRDAIFPHLPHDVQSHLAVPYALLDLRLATGAADIHLRWLQSRRHNFNTVDIF